MRIAYRTALLAAVAPFLIPTAHAQRDYTFPPAPPIRGSLSAGGRVWKIGNPEMVARSGVRSVLPSPDFKHLLIVRQIRVLTADVTSEGEDGNASGEITITWWNVRTHRSREVWRRPVAPGERVGLFTGGWLGKTGIAVFRVADGTNPDILYINPATGQVRDVSLPPRYYDFPHPSPSQPYVGLVGPDGACEGDTRFVDRNGNLGEPIPLPSNIFFSRWSEDGTVYLGLGSALEPDGKRVDQWYAVNPAKRTVTAIPEPKKTATGETDYDNFADPAEGLPIRLSRDKATQSLYIEMFPQSKARVLLSADGDPVFLMPDGSGAFFRRDGALYFAPIVSAPAPSDSSDVPNANKNR